MPLPAGSDQFRVLIVCSANQCRSPMAEHLLRQTATNRGLHWHIESAGTAARDGRPIHPLAEAALQARGVLVGPWSSRRLNVAAVERADLILTAEAKHRSAVIALSAAAIPRTFPILQFARLTGRVVPFEADDDTKLGLELVSRAVASRHNLQPVPQGSEDLVDPIGQRRKAFLRCADTIATATDAILRPLNSVQVA